MSETDTATNSRQIQNSLPFLIMAVWSFTHGEFHHFSSWQFYLLTTVSFTHHGAFGIKLNCNSCLAGFHWKFRLYAKTLNILLNLKAGGKLNSQQFKKLSQRAFFILSALFRGKGRLSPSCSWSKIPIVIFWPNAITPQAWQLWWWISSYFAYYFLCLYLHLHPRTLSLSLPPHFIFICVQEDNESADAEKEPWRNNRLQMLAQKSSFQIETKCKFKLQANPDIIEHRNPLFKLKPNANSNCKQILIYLSTEILF